MGLSAAGWGRRAERTGGRGRERGMRPVEGVVPSAPWLALERCRPATMEVARRLPMPGTRRSASTSASHRAAYVPKWFKRFARRVAPRPLVPPRAVSADSSAAASRSARWPSSAVVCASSRARRSSSSGFDSAPPAGERHGMPRAPPLPAPTANAASALASWSTPLGVSHSKLADSTPSTPSLSSPAAAPMVWNPYTVSLPFARAIKGT